MERQSFRPREDDNDDEEGKKKKKKSETVILKEKKRLRKKTMKISRWKRGREREGEEVLKECMKK